jgi:hypothetical protein
VIRANAAMYPQSWRASAPAASPRSPRKFARAVGIAFVAAALGAAAATVVAAYDDQVSAQQLITHRSVRTPLPTDLFSRPALPKPRVVVQYQYVAPRTQPAAPMAAPMTAQPMTAQPMTVQPAPVDPTAAPTVQPTSAPRPHRSPSPTPSASGSPRGGDD